MLIAQPDQWCNATSLALGGPIVPRFFLKNVIRPNRKTFPRPSLAIAPTISTLSTDSPYCAKVIPYVIKLIHAVQVARP